MRAFLLLLLLLPAAGPAAEAGRAELGALRAEPHALLGLTRTVLAWRPATPGRVPLVLALHGGGGTAKGMARLTGFTALAQAEGFAVLFPDSGVKAWNDGRPDMHARREPLPDSAWLAALAQEAVAQGWADPKRLYACGISNGGFMSLRLACEQAGTFAAIGAVAAAGAYGPCPDGPPIPLCFFVGTEDPIVPFKGGPIQVLSWARERGQAEPFEQAFEAWRGRDHAGVAQESLLPDLDPGDGTRVHWRRCAAGPGGADLQAYLVQGGGHAWPLGWPYMGRWMIGRTSRDLDASRALWDFFQAHPKP